MEGDGKCRGREGEGRVRMEVWEASSEGLMDMIGGNGSVVGGMVAHWREWRSIERLDGWRGELPTPALHDLKGPSVAKLLADGLGLRSDLTKRLGSVLKALDKIASPHFIDLMSNN